MRRTSDLTGGATVFSADRIICIGGYGRKNNNKHLGACFEPLVYRRLDC
jgi:hypothetical protein